MSSSKFDSPLTIIKNPGTHLLLVGQNKDDSYSLYSYTKSYNVSPKDKCDEIQYSNPIKKISLAKQEKSWFLVVTQEFVEIHKLDKETGKLTMMHRFQADFDTENPKVNTAEFLYENQYVVTGGNDKVVRAWKLDIGKDNDIVKGVGHPRKFTSHTTPIQHVDVTFDHELIASVGSAEEKRCLIHDFQTCTLTNELTFSEKVGAENMAFKGCVFSLHRKYLYTLVSEPGKKSYVTRWDAKSGEFRNLNTITVATNECKNFSMSFEGFYLAIGSLDGFIKSLNTRYMQIDRNDKHHAGVMECVDFSSDTRFILTCDKEGNYCFVPNIRAPGYMRFFFQGLMAFMLGFYIYRLIMEAYFE
jgi:WD40 repeat protein